MRKMHCSVPDRSDNEVIRPDDYYDVAVVGCGPAGATAALKAASAGIKTIVFERDRQIGVPVRCGEMAVTDDLTPHFKVDDRFIENRIELQEFITPDGLVTRLKPKGSAAILDRKRFDAYIAGLAARAGAEILVRADVTGMMRNKAHWHVDYTYQGTRGHVKAGIVIAADGVESKTARWAGVKTDLALFDVASAYQYELVCLKISRPEINQYYFGSEIAPGGFIWIFPKSKERANVGIGVLASRTNGGDAKRYLDRFIGDRLPGAQCTREVCGAVPLARPLKVLSADGLLIAGDAGRLVESMGGSGIILAVQTGALAGETAADAIRRDRTDAKFLHRYAAICNKRHCRTLRILYAVSKILKTSNDEQLSRINALAREIGADKLTVLDYCKIIARNNPGLIAQVASLLLK